jgi:protein-S-isoprenylcysteine O-methyltransferase Ste14
MTDISARNITIGQWFFRYRNIVFPIIFTASPLILLKPRIMFGSPALDCLLVAGGVVITLLGAGMRLLTIGLEYIDRGGRNKQVWASRLVQTGMYAHSRNPMYLGNLLIAVGMCMVSGAPAAYLILIPLFVFIYQAIVAAEESYLHHTFGADYVAYCSRVPCLLPSIKGLRQTVASTGYHWRRAIRKDLGTIAGLLVGLLCWSLWRTYFLEGFDAAKAKAPIVLGLILLVLILYSALHYLKKRKLFFYLPTNLPPDIPWGLR